MNLEALVAFASLSFGACASLPENLDGLQPDRSQDVKQELARPTSARDALVAIARLEDQRSDGGGMLVLLAAHGDPRVRTRALRALGRLPTWRYKAVTEAIVHALDDQDAAVRASAAFALGMRGDPLAEPALLAHAGDADEQVRARAVEAASKLATPALQELVLAALADVSVTVRIEAAEGVQRFPVEVPEGAPTAEQASAALIEFVQNQRKSAEQAAREGEGQARDPVEDEPLWRALASLARRKATAAVELFRSEARVGAGRSRWARFFATKGLAECAALAKDDALRAALEQAASEGDWILAAEALRGLSRLADLRSVEALAAATTHASAHVRTGAVQALGKLPQGEGRVLGLLRAARDDASRGVRAAAIVALVARGEEREVGELSTLSHDDDPVIRRAVVLAATELESAQAEALLLPLTRDASLFVATAAIAALEKHPTEALRQRLHEALAGEDNGLCLASAEVLANLGEHVPLDRLREAWRGAEGDIGPEARAALLRLADLLPASPEVDRFLQEAVVDPDPHVRLLAHRFATGRGLTTNLPAGGNGSAREALVSTPVERASQAGNPRVEIVTTRGVLEFELFPAEAPRHAQSFLELAGRDHYDGLSFHRVEPGFVVQGGCYRGDGNGGGSSRGSALRHEIGPRKYTRGSLGMPRNEDLESGGSQIFVTHVPTPHLDGRYTIFGELRSGFEVLDQLEVGDQILDVRSR